MHKIDRSTAIDLSKGGKPYAAPGLRCISPEASREMLLEHSDVNDPEVKFMLQCIDRLQHPKGS